MQIASRVYAFHCLEHCSVSRIQIAFQGSGCCNEKENKKTRHFSDGAL